MKRLLPILVAVGLSFNVAAADVTAGAAQANAFMSIYATTCIKHLNDLDSLRSKLASIPNLPPEKAKHFLPGGMKGKAWPVPDKNGTFVLSIPDEKNFCSVHALKVGQLESQQLFKQQVQVAPPPLTSRLVEKTSRETPVNGVATTVSYEWSAPNAPRRLLFILTTADSPTAQLQGMVSASYVQ